MLLKECFAMFIELEEKTASIYSRIAELIDKQELIEICLTIGQQEKEHVNMLVKALRKFDELDQVVPELGFLVELTAKHNRLSDTELAFKTLKEFFLFVLQCEKDFLTLYNEFKAMFKPETLGYRVFADLVNEERRHMYSVLQQLYEIR